MAEPKKPITLGVPATGKIVTIIVSGSGQIISKSPNVKVQRR